MRRTGREKHVWHLLACLPARVASPPALPASRIAHPTRTYSHAGRAAAAAAAAVIYRPGAIAPAEGGAWGGTAGQEGGLGRGHCAGAGGARWSHHRSRATALGPARGPGVARAWFGSGGGSNRACVYVCARVIWTSGRVGERRAAGRARGVTVARRLSSGRRLGVGGCGKRRGARRGRQGAHGSARWCARRRDARARAVGSGLVWTPEWAGEPSRAV